MKSLYLSQSLLRLSLVVALVAPLLSLLLLRPRSTGTSMATTEIFGVKIEKNPPDSKLNQLGVTSWRKWEGGQMKIPWSFTARETMYLLEGRVKITVDGHEESFEIRGGYLVVFPKGMNITWEVIEPVKKHFSLEE